MNPITSIRSRILVLPAENMNTDQIIPARFLSTTEKSGLGPHAFADWRKTQKQSPLDDERARECSVLVAGRNFGCGSSREHAVWALADMGIVAVISTEIADIFRSNALENHVIPVVVGEEFHRTLVTHPFEEVDVRVDTLEVHFGQETSSFHLDEYHKRLLINGMNTLEFLLSMDQSISDFESRRLSMECPL